MVSALSRARSFLVARRVYPRTSGAFRIENRTSVTFATESSRESANVVYMETRRVCLYRSVPSFPSRPVVLPKWLSWTVKKRSIGSTPTRIATSRTLVRQLRRRKTMIHTNSGGSGRYFSRTIRERSLRLAARCS